MRNAEDIRLTLRMGRQFTQERLKYEQQMSVTKPPPHRIQSLKKVCRLLPHIWQSFWQLEGAVVSLGIEEVVPSLTFVTEMTESTFQNP